MKKISLFFFYILFMSNVTVFAQQYAVSEIPKELLNRANAVLRTESDVFDMRNDANFIQTTNKAITIMNKAGEGYAEMVIYYDKSRTIKDIKGQIFNATGIQIGKFGSKDFKDYSATSQSSMYDDIRVKHYSPNINTYPYTIVYSCEIKHSQNLFIPYWQPNYFADISVQQSTYQLICKPEQALRIKTENITDPVQVSENEKAKTYTWKVSNINARKEEPYLPNTQKDAMIVKVAPEYFQYYKRKGKVNNWSDFGQWVYTDLLNGKNDLSLETKNKVKELTASLNTDREKAKAVYEYMQNKTRYISIQIGIGGLEPFPASYVDRLGYGDCKALVNYTQALLKEAGISSLYCIVEAGNRKKSLDLDFANAVDGNHIILCVPLEKDTVWLECTSNRHPFGYLGNFTDDRLVLACTAEGGKILKTKFYSAEDNIQRRIGQFAISENGNIDGQITTTFTGTQFDNHFENISKSQTEQLKTLKQYYDIDNISFSKNRYEVKSTPEPTLIENIDVSIKSYVVKSNNQLIFHPNLFNVSKSIQESKNRVNPLYINRGYTDIDSLTFTVKDKLATKFQPINKKLECPVGSYELNIEMKEGIITLHRKLNIREGTYPAEDYEKYYTFMREVSAADRGKFTLALATD